MMLTNNTWIGLKGVGSPSRRAPRIDPIAAMLVVSWKRTKCRMLS